MYTWTFAKTFAKKKILSPFQKQTLAATVHYIPKGLRKGNPFHGPFAQLSYINMEPKYGGIEDDFPFQSGWLFEVLAVNLQEVETPWIPKTHQTSRKTWCHFAHLICSTISKSVCESYIPDKSVLWNSQKNKPCAAMFQHLRYSKQHNI